MNDTHWDEAKAAAFGARLAKAREAKGFSLASLAERVKVSKATAGHWENAKRTIKIQDLAAVCTVLGISADELLFGARRWPFERLEFDSVANLDKRDLDRLEGALFGIAHQIGIEIKEVAA